MRLPGPVGPAPQAAASFGHLPPPDRRGAPSGGALRFATLAEIASGDTARIDLCRVSEPDAQRGRLVATKRLHAHLLADTELASMFFDEVWMTASLRHPNVVEVVGWGEDDEGPYLAVELVEGVSLARLTKTVFDTGEIFGERMVVYVGSQICRGLAAAHGLGTAAGEPLGLVHRDLTPGNVLVGFEGRVKITDFGLAKAKQRITRTVTGLLKGRPQYMAPEQARGDAVDSRADLFSLGVVLFELFAGRRPWSGATEFEVLSTTQNDPPAELRELRPKIDRELSSLVMRLLEKAPGDRFESASEVGIRLDEWLAVHGWSEGNDEALARFVRRNAMRQMRWFERAIKGDLPVPRRRARAGSSPALAEMRPSRRERAKKVGDDATEVSMSAADASLLDDLDRQDTLREPFAAVDETRAVVHESQRVAAREELGEEIPTLVQRERPLTPGLPAAPSVRANRPLPPLPFPILEEDSDQRATGVKGRGPLPGSGAGPGDDIADPETETIPIKGPRQQAVKAALDAALGTARGAALPPPRPPPRTERASVPPPSSAPPAPPPSVHSPSVHSPSVHSPSVHSPSAQMGGPGAAPISAPPTSPRGPWTVESVHEAADRMATLARRLGDAAALATHAAHAASSGDLHGATRLMDEAERAAAAAQRGDAEPQHPETQQAASPAPGIERARPAYLSAPVDVRVRVEPDPGFSPRASSVESLTAMSLRFRPMILGLPPVAAAAVAVLAMLALLLLVLLVAG